VKLCSL